MQVKPLESSIDIHVGGLANLLLPWRQDTAAKGIPPHVTILYPWRTPPLSGSDIDSLRAAMAGHAILHLHSIERCEVAGKILGNPPLALLVHASRQPPE